MNPRPPAKLARSVQNVDRHDAVRLDTPAVRDSPDMYEPAQCTPGTEVVAESTGRKRQILLRSTASVTTFKTLLSFLLESYHHSSMWLQIKTSKDPSVKMNQHRPHECAEL